MRFFPFVLFVSASTACGAVLGSGDDDVEPPARGEDAGTDVVIADGGGPTADVVSSDASSDAPADAIEAGPTTKHVFVSSTTYTGNFGTLADADDLCTFLAKQADAGAFASSKFKAYLASGAGAPAAARITDRTYVRMDEKTVFAPGPQTNQAPSDLVVIDEKGNDLSGAGSKFVWTGMAGSAPAAQRTCAGWTTSDGGTFGGYGDMHTIAQWADQNGATAGCDSQYRIYCFEE